MTNQIITVHRILTQALIVACAVVGSRTDVRFLNSYDLGGSFHDANIVLEFIPVKWFGISLGYYVLDVELDVPVERWRAYMNYKFNGPTAGIWFRF